MVSELTPPPLEGDIDLVVWPETVFAQQPPVDEGAVTGQTLDAARGGPRVAHLAA